MSEKSGAYAVQAGGDHYKNFAIQPGEYCHKNKLGNYESYAIKYITRYPVKWRGNRAKQLEDLDKAIHCIELLKEELTIQPKDYTDEIEDKIGSTIMRRFYPTSTG